ncbi:MAG: hypothetical protein J1F11_03365 [Oscillospiraceae bacterium]|nr:hypothetical protein [Oscillospiraceae bacterium]
MARGSKQKMNKPDQDRTEEIIRTLSDLILTSIQRLSDEDLEDVDPMKLMKQASDLIRLTAYKKSVDIKNKKLSEVGFGAVKDKVFEALARQYPELYEKLAAAIDELSEEEENYNGGEE